VTKLLREPLVHFLLLGALLFLAFDVYGKRSDAAPGSIRVTRGEIAALAAGYEQTWLRAPTPKELDALIEDQVRGEIYYREAIALGLDKGDTVVRRRLREKLEFVSEDSAAQAEPTDEILRAHYAAHAEAFRGADGVSPPFDTVRDRVRIDWESAKRLEAGEAFYRELRQKYAVVVEGR